MTKKDAYYFSHDSNARSDPKIMALISAYGMEGYGRWWVVVELLREQKDHKLKICKLSTNALAMAMLCDAKEAEKFINDCLHEFELLVTDERYFWSKSLLRRMEVKEEMRQRRVEAGRKGAEVRWKDGNAMAPPKQPHGTAIAKDGKERKGKERKGKQKDISTYEHFFEMLWQAYPRKKGKGQVSNAQKKRLHDIGREKLEACIAGYKQDMEKEGRPLDKYQYGSTFFNSGYVDYLDQDKPEEKKRERPKLVIVGTLDDM